MTLSKNNDGFRAAAADFDRPLLLTAAQDFRGWLLGHLGRWAITAVAGVSVAAVLLIFIFIIKESWAFVATHGLGELLGSTQWYPKGSPETFGALALLGGSAYVTVGSMLLAVPVGLMTALCLSDMVPFGVRQIIKPAIEILAAIPSVAFGFFAIMIVAPFMQNTLGLRTGANILNASLILAIMAIPTIVSVAEDALSAVGRDVREASYALGATRAETLVKVVVPAAHNGIIAAIILGMMRAIGETMVVWMAAGGSRQLPTPWWNLAESIGTMTATIAAEMGETPVGSDHRRALFAIGLVLLAFTFLMNLVTEYFLRRVRKASGGVQA